jgi:molybdopterin-containing oxidoreductase family iron-sulfur binding subunit
MAVNRRRFLKIAGLCALGAAGKPCLDSLPTAEASEKAKRASEPGGKRWAMAVNLKMCKGEEGCTKCIDACHLAHNVPKFDNPKDEVKWIWAENFEHSFPGHHHEFIEEGMKKRPVLVFCNHCDNPPCVRVCPTQATFRRKDGIIMMDYHRCIGCRYCVAACPYGSRSFNWRDPRPFIKELNPEFPTRCRGVVEKCNFCAERLVRGLQPACVEACPEGGMVFGDLEDPESEIRAVLKENYTIRRKASLGTNPEVYYIV